MKRSTERILTTHTGSLPRPPDLVDLIYARDAGEGPDDDAFFARVADAVRDVVRAQIDAGVDVINDGEMGKVSYYAYVQDRLSGFAGYAVPSYVTRDLADFPEYARSRSPASPRPGLTPRRPACVGPIAYTDPEAPRRDARILRDALEGTSPADTFLSAASPGILSMFLVNQYYPGHEAYLFALADAMKTEYDAIHHAGFNLQIDCPDLALGRHTAFADGTIEDYRKVVALHIDALNHATRDIPPERLRMHLCWGNYEGPHHYDVPLADIIDLVLERARPIAVSFEGANPRHEHEYIVFDDVRLPPGKFIMPGVLDSTTNFIEHPEVVAHRIMRYAERVGRENVMPGSDCGFGTGAGRGAVDASIVWAKLQSLAEGARRASERLWR